MKRCVEEIRRGFDGVDGAGVSLVRVLNQETIKKLDPFLMLDIFDSNNYEDYIAGFPMHPHRGIETITYLLAGEIDHEDSIGNKGRILPGGTQWMTAGSGIMHQEMPQKSDNMIGFQLWLNMPQKDKMSAPAYHELNKEQLPVYEEDGLNVRVISGEFKGVEGGIKPDYVRPQIYFIEADEGKAFTKTCKPKDTAFIFIFRGSVRIGDEVVDLKNGVLFAQGDEIEIHADTDAKFMYIEGEKINETVSWGGPIVMNTKEELNLAFEELRNGTFLKTRHVLGVEGLNK
ncbi:MAG TPA: pirin family protein [Treponemataceae bacterium]|nr:pirin family protein [Treponemataceae bacterium]